MEEEKKRETDKNVERIQDEIIASIESIYQSIENIGKVNKEVAQMLITRIQTLRADTDNKQMLSIEMLSELMSIQRETIGILDTDYYKQTTMYFQTKDKKVAEEKQDKNMLLTVSQNPKNGFWHELFEKITRKQLGKYKTDISSDLENTPTIKTIAVDRYENFDKKDSFVVVDEDGFQEDFRYPVYEQLKKMEKRKVGLDIFETIQLGDRNNCIIHDTGPYLDVYIDGRRWAIPTTDEKGGISNSEFGKVLEFAKFLGGTKESEFKLEVLKVLRGFQNLDGISKQDRKRFKKEMDANELYTYYRDMYRKAIEEYRATFKDFYYQRDKAKMQYKKDVRNQVRVEENGEHPNLHGHNDAYKERRNGSKIQIGEDYGEH